MPVTSQEAPVYAPQLINSNAYLVVPSKMLEIGMQC